MLRLVLAMSAALAAAPMAEAGSPARIVVADRADALFRSVALGDVEAPSRRGGISSEARKHLLKADFLAADGAGARFELKVAVIEKAPSAESPSSGAAPLLESTLTLVRRDGGAVVASASAEGGDRDAIARGFAALALKLGEKNLVRVRAAASCADLNPNGLGVAYISRTLTQVGVDCPS